MAFGASLAISLGQECLLPRNRGNCDGVSLTQDTPLLSAGLPERFYRCALPLPLTCAAPGQGLLAWEQPRKFQKRKKFGCRERKRQGEPAARRCKPGRRARQSDVAFHSPTESSSTTPLALAAPNDSAATSSRLRAPSFPLAFAALRSRSSGSNSR